MQVVEAKVVKMLPSALRGPEQICVFSVDGASIVGRSSTSQPKSPTKAKPPQRV